MTRFVAVLRRPGADSPRAEVERLLEGRTGAWRVTERPGACFAFDAAIPGSEEEGREDDVAEAGTAHDPRTGEDLLFSGRLDNRSELVAALDGVFHGGSCPQEHASHSGDAQLVLAALRAWGADGLGRLLGSFVFVRFDARGHRLLAVRDALGDRSLYTFRDGRRVVAASELPLVLGHPAVSRDVDETSLAHFFAVEAPPPGSTYFASVREVPPGHSVELSPDGEEARSYWPPASIDPIRHRCDADYVDAFRELLAESVRCRMPADAPVAVLMSGGLDSTSVAAAAAREASRRGSPGAVHSISWVFDELPRADERRFLEPVVKRLGLVGHQIVGDREWPLRDLASWPVRAEAPWQGPYCRLQNAAYGVAREHGVRVLLTGEFGDHLFADTVFWLRDLLTDRGPAAAWRGLRGEVSRRGAASILRSGPLRSAVSRALGWRGRPSKPPAWLTPNARSRVAASRRAWRDAPFPLPPRDRVRPFPWILDPLCALASSLEHPTARRAGIDLRRPFRDRRLIEFMLAMPAHLLRRPGWTKWILREALRGVLPEPVRERRQVSTLLPLTARGLVEREAERVQEILGRPDAQWRRHVDADWLVSTFPQRLAQGLDGVESVVAWQCLCYELWADAGEELGSNG